MTCENDHIVCANCYPHLPRNAVPDGRVSCPICRVVGPFTLAPDIDGVIAALNDG